MMTLQQILNAALEIDDVDILDYQHEQVELGVPLLVFLSVDDFYPDYPTESYLEKHPDATELDIIKNRIYPIIVKTAMHIRVYPNLPRQLFDGFIAAHSAMSHLIPITTC